MLDKPIFPDHLSILENPFIPRYWGSAPFDDEGVRPSERLVVDHGVLSGLFLSSYSARKLGMTTTGNAGGPYNLIFSEAPEASEKTLSALLSRMGTGLLVTELIGQGVNYTTGDFSKGASGFWVENGRIAYPVEGITVAGNLRDIFMSIEAMSDDVDLNGCYLSGSVLIKEMTVAGNS